MKFSVTGIIGINKEACDCQTCVNDMVLIYCLIIELYKVLAEHMLINLSAKANSFVQIDTIDLCKDINVLRTIAGTDFDVVLIREILQLFSVGIYPWKDLPGPPLPVNVRPLRECKFISPVKTEKDMINKRKDTIKSLR